MAEGLTYLDFAENDYSYFNANYEEGRVANNMAAEAQNACEKYLKHIIEQYDVNNELNHTGVLRTHNLQTLINYLKDEMNIQISNEEESCITCINGYYFDTRYPGDSSVFATRSMIEKCHKALEMCRNITFEIIRDYEHDREQFAQNIEQNSDDIDYDDERW